MKFVKYLFNRLDNTTAWIGIIGLTLMLLQFHTALIILFVLMFVLPEGNFSDLFKGWTRELRSTVDEVTTNPNQPRPSNSNHGSSRKW